MAANKPMCGHLRLFECAGLPEGKYIERQDCLLCEVERYRQWWEEHGQTIDRLRAALEYYAKTPAFLQTDGGARAREALRSNS